MLLILILTLPVWYMIHAASKEVRAHEGGLARAPARILISVVWVIIWLLLLTAVGSAIGPRPLFGLLMFEILSLGFFAVFRFTRGLRSRRSGSGSAGHLASESQPAVQHVPSVAEAADEFHKARRAEREVVGQEAILNYLKGEMLRHKVESVRAIAFNWNYDSRAAQWILHVCVGTRHLDLRFEQADIEVWSSQPELVGKYDRAVLDLIETLERDF